MIEIPRDGDGEDWQWQTDELLPACRCSLYEPMDAHTLAVGESKLLRCASCGDWERVYRRGERQFVYGLVGTVLQLGDEGVARVPLYDDLVGEDS